ncbi:Abi family protein [Noviherbaspirillum galbum]|uniref:Abi family protein n=1 Tax=Noviherbaspirillum galbum TaxID=2709383 RepID=A0A6B3SN63_9BURK|nr:Abi family protein [Noviherbaspirillum galbum]NEX60196.1 Abi family protein [Noviherbaspirillum galbum]
MKPAYKKPHLSYQQQLDLLKQRGLTISNEQDALRMLEVLGYYRLSGYLYPFRKFPALGTTPFRRLDEFIAGTTFQHAVDLYHFDSELKLLIMSAIEKIEVAVRAKIAYHMGGVDPFCYANPVHLDPKFSKLRFHRVSGDPMPSYFDEWQKKFGENFTRSNEEFINHFRSNYAPPLPIWIAIEVWDFGLLSRFYAGLLHADRIAVTPHFGLGSEESLFASWLRALNYLRNVCAHHSRLWNRSLVDQPKSPKRGMIPKLDHIVGQPHAMLHLYGILCILQHLLKQIDSNNVWGEKLKRLLATFPTLPAVATLHAMGFPANWHNEALWN